MEYLGVLEWIGVLRQGLTSTTNKYFVNETKTMLKLSNVHYLPMILTYSRTICLHSLPFICALFKTNKLNQK